MGFAHPRNNAIEEKKMSNFLASREGKPKIPRFQNCRWEQDPKKRLTPTFTRTSSIGSDLSPNDKQTKSR